MNRMASVHASSRGLTVFRLGVLSLLVVLAGFLLNGCGGEPSLMFTPTPVISTAIPTQTVPTAAPEPAARACPPQRQRPPKARRNRRQKARMV